MEQILGSIRRIIAADQAALGMPLEEARPRAPRRATEPARPPAPEAAPAAQATRRPPVRLAPAPPVDYRPRDARAGPPAPEQHAAALPDIVSRTVSEQIERIARSALDAALAEGESAWAAAALQPEPQAPAAGPAPQPEPPQQPEPQPPAPAQEAVQQAAVHGAATLADHLPRGGAVFGVAVAHHSAHPGLPANGAASGPLVSPAAAARISGAFDALTRRVAAERARTMEETVTDMLRPMLAQWLEANLPAIVERLVAEQLELLARGSGRPDGWS